MTISPQDKLERVIEEMPEALYRYLNALNYDDAFPESQEAFKEIYAGIMYDLYLKPKPYRDLPDDLAVISDDISYYLEIQETEASEINRIEAAAKHRAYIKAHNLEYVLEAIEEYDTGLQPDRSLDYEFVYEVHYKTGYDFERNPEVIIEMFAIWLEVLYSL